MEPRKARRGCQSAKESHGGADETPEARRRGLHTYESRPPGVNPHVAAEIPGAREHWLFWRKKTQKSGWRGNGGGPIEWWKRFRVF